MSDHTPDLRDMIGDVDPTLATAAAVWVGTDASLEVVRDWAQSQAAWKGRILSLLERCGCDPTGARFEGNTLVGFAPRDPDTVPEGLVRSTSDPSVLVADPYTEAGAEIIEEISAVNSEFQTLYQALGGLTGAQHLSEGNDPIAVIGNGSHPVMYLAEDEPQSVKGRIMADPELWTPVSPADISALVG